MPVKQAYRYFCNGARMNINAFNLQVRPALQQKTGDRAVTGPDVQDSRVLGQKVFYSLCYGPHTARENRC